MIYGLISECSYTIIIFTNQAGIRIETGATRLINFKIKVAAVLSKLDIPLTLYGATENDMYRKPRLGMWNEMVEDYDLDVHGVVKDESFLIGDAAGREGDHSASDRYAGQAIQLLYPNAEQSIRITIKALCSKHWYQVLYARGILSWAAGKAYEGCNIRSHDFT